MLEQSEILKTIVERIITQVGPGGKTRHASTNKNYEVRSIDGKPTEVLAVKRHATDKHRSQRLYKSPGVLRGAAFRGKVTRLGHKLLGLSSVKGPKKREDSNLMAHIKSEHGAPAPAISHHMNDLKRDLRAKYDKQSKDLTKRRKSIGFSS